MRDFQGQLRAAEVVSETSPRRIAVYNESAVPRLQHIEVPKGAIEDILARYWEREVVITAVKQRDGRFHYQSIQLVDED